MGGSVSRPVGAAAAGEALAIVKARVLAVVVATVIGLVGGALFGNSREDASATSVVRLGIFPLSQNQAAISLGVSTPVGPLGADFSSDAVIGEVARRTGESADRLREVLGIADVPFDVHQLALEVSGVDEGEAKRLLGAWIATIQVQRRAFIAQRVDDARAGLLEDLHDSRSRIERRQAVEDLAALSALGSSLRSDVTVLRRPYRVVSATRSLLSYILAGGLIGAFAGVAIALGLGLLERRLYTPAAIAARFGLPVIADLRSEGGVAKLGKRVELSGAASGPLIVVGVGGGEAAERVIRALGDRGPAKAVVAGPIDEPETIALLHDAGTWVFAVSPSLIRADQVDGTVAELVGAPSRPLGLVLV